MGKHYTLVVAIVQDYQLNDLDKSKYTCTVLIVVY